MSQTFLRELLAHGVPSAVIYDLLKRTIPTERIQAYLRFRTEVRHGHNLNHLVNASAFAVETRFHVIRENESLCGRRSQRFSVTTEGVTCPGCTAIGKNLAAFGLSEPVDIERVTVVDVMKLADMLARF